MSFQNFVRSTFNLMRCRSCTTPYRFIFGRKRQHQFQSTSRDFLCTGNSQRSCVTYFSSSSGRNDFRMSKACQLLEKEAVKDLLESIDTILFDCDGVLWEGAATSAIPGVPEVLQRLRDLGKRIFFVSNNSTKTQAEYADKCRKYGFPCSQEEMICSAYATAQYIKNTLKYSGKSYMIGSPGLAGEFEKAGLRFFGLGEDLWNGREMQDLASIELDPDVKCVVVGYDKHFNYIKLHKAQAYLSDPACHFIATNTDSALPLGNRKLLPGTGCFVKSVAYAAGREPVICGKPHSPIGDILVDTHNVNPSRALMVGDRLDTDMLLAHNCGMKSLLVLTGFATLDDVEKKRVSESVEDRNSVPDYYLRSLAGLGSFLPQQ